MAELKLDGRAQPEIDASPPREATLVREACSFFANASPEVATSLSIVVPASGSSSVLVAVAERIAEEYGLRARKDQTRRPDPGHGANSTGLSSPVTSDTPNSPRVVKRRVNSDKIAMPPLMPDLEAREVVRGATTGTRFVRVQRRSSALLRTGEATLEATSEAHVARSLAGRWFQLLRNLIIGAPLATATLAHQRLSKVKALAVFSSDALSSSAYATEEILLVLILAGTGSLGYSIPIAAAIAGMMLIVTISYRQTVRAYPNGGGAYIVGRDNLGNGAGMTAASALLVDYVLTVAVSTAAGVAAITSAFPELDPYAVEIAVACVGLITTVNLRGVRESATVFALPTYFFIGSFAIMLVVGFVRVAAGLGPLEQTDAEAEAATQSLTLFLILRAFSSGSAA